MSAPFDLPADHPFGPHHLPYGAVSLAGGGDVRLAVRLGDHELHRAGVGEGRADREG